MNNVQETNNWLVMSYLNLRRSIGVLGISLPFVVAIGKIVLQSPGILNSISAYYYSIMGDVFVGTLCATGVFLWSYQGYDRRDAIAATFTALAAIGVALFPTTPAINPTVNQTWIGMLHFMFAAAFFLALAYFALVLFRKTNPNVPATRMKLMRNKVYTICGYTILAAIALIVALRYPPDDSAILTMSPVFWLESIACVAFGISWLVKGEAILSDE